MTQTRPVQVAFSSGEIDPLLHERVDFQRFQTGLATSSGFLPFRQGGITRAPGTIYRGTTKDNKVAVRLPFTFARNDSLALEFTDQLMRVWRYGALVESGGSPYELVTPFLEADLFGLEFVQKGDLIYIVDGQRPMQVLRRLALDNWTIAEADLQKGPFRVQNLDEAVTVHPTASTGTITLNGVGSPFVADHVGALFLIEPTDFNNVPIWVQNQTAAVGDWCIYDDRIYQLSAGTNTGYNPPQHSAGSVLSDPTTGAIWDYMSDTKGIVKITAYTDANTVTADVLKTIPKPAVDDPTYRWSEGAWSARYGYPRRLASYRRRLYAANSTDEPRTLWASRIGDFLDLEPSDLSDGAFAYTIDGEEELNEISWLRGGKRGVYIGALGEVLLGFSAVQGEAIGPLTFDTELIDSDGAAAIRPIKPYGYPVYISIEQGRAHEARYVFAEDGSHPVELSLPAQHLGAEIFEQIVWQSASDKYGWLRRQDGTLVCMVYDPKQEVLGWAPVPVAGGFVEHMDITVSADGAYDVLTMIVRRTINGQTVRYVEEQAINRPGLLGQVDPCEINHALAGSVFDVTPATDTFSLPHLAGESVYAWTDLGHRGPLTVAANGDVVLPDAVSKAIIGLADATHKLRTLQVPAQGRNGDTRGRKRRLEGGTGIGLYKTAAGHIRVIEKDFGEAEVAGDLHELVPRGVALDILADFTGMQRVDVPSGHAEAAAYEIVPEGIAPLTMTALIPNIDEAGA